MSHDFNPVGPIRGLFDRCDIIGIAKKKRMRAEAFAPARIVLHSEAGVKLTIKFAGQLIAVHKICVHSGENSK